MKKERTEMLPTASRPRPPEAGKIAVAAQEKLADIPGKTLTIQIIDVPPCGKVPEHHHGGTAIAYVLSGAFRMQLEGCPEGIYQAGQTFLEPFGAVHLFAENLSRTDPAKLMLIHVADDGKELTVIH
jgi:quercetin dioxygenase-like cupin family protein